MEVYMKSKLSGRQEFGDGFLYSNQPPSKKEKDFLSLVSFSGILTHWRKCRDY